MEAVNDATKYIAKAIEELKLMGTFEWVDGNSAKPEMDVVIDYLEKALSSLTKT